jgi:hypothetical protein
MIDCLQFWTWTRENQCMGQGSLFSRSEIAGMRDRTRSRKYSAARDDFRREHERHRAWGLQRRHAEKLRRIREGRSTSPEVVNSAAPATPPASSSRRPAARASRSAAESPRPSSAVNLVAVPPGVPRPSSAVNLVAVPPRVPQPSSRAPTVSSPVVERSSPAPALSASRPQRTGVEQKRASVPAGPKPVSPPAESKSVPRPSGRTRTALLSALMYPVIGGPSARRAQREAGPARGGPSARRWASGGCWLRVRPSSVRRRQSRPDRIAMRSP